MNEDTQLSDAEIERSSVKVLIVKWIAKQGVTTVLLIAILGAILYGGYYAMTTAIPQHLDRIQAGYREVSIEHRTAIETIEKSRDADRAANDRARSDFLELIREQRRMVSKPTVANGSEAGS